MSLDIFDTVKSNLKERGFSVRVFETASQAADYLNQAIQGENVGFGGSVTLEQLGLYELLCSHNQVHWHWKNGAEIQAAAAANVYITSANALAETGELMNIDGVGNRIASGLYGHPRVYFVVGRNKLAPSFEDALWRARNIAAPKNARRLGKNTPCARQGDRCYDCRHPERICRGLAVHWAPMPGVMTEVVLIDEDLGF